MGRSKAPSRGEKEVLESDFGPDSFLCQLAPRTKNTFSAIQSVKGALGKWLDLWLHF